MKLTVIIASAGRPEILAETLRHLAQQERLPDELVISAPEAEDVPDLGSLGFPARCIYGTKGLAAQRNRALDDALDSTDIITFFDDDFLPARNYLALLEASFRDHPEFSVIHGYVVADGAHNEGYSFEQGLSTLAAAERTVNSETPVVIRDHAGAYGCNMSFRASQVGDLRFDERLALYGWQEDIDFTNQLGRQGRIVSISNMLGVHLGVKAGRVNGTRLGYSQIANPIYLVRKGTMPAGFAAELLARNITANVVKSFWPEPWVDRRGRLGGNLIALSHVLRGRIEPEYVTKL